MLLEDKVLEACMETSEDLDTDALFATAEVKWGSYEPLRHGSADALCHSR
jgi:hypothetical protein